MTFQDAIADARSELGDTYEGSHAYADSDMIRYAVDGVREAWRLRPSLRYDVSTGRLYDAEKVITGDNGQLYIEIPLPDNVQSAISCFIVYSCLLRDVTDESNAQAAATARDRFDQIVMR